MEKKEGLDEGQVGKLEIENGPERDEIGDALIQWICETGMAVSFEDTSKTKKYFGQAKRGKGVEGRGRPIDESKVDNKSEEITMGLVESPEQSGAMNCGEKKEYILARLHSIIKLSRSAHSWWKQIEVHDKRTTDQREHAFFKEYKNELECVFVQSTETVVKELFREYGIMEEHLPQIRIDKSYSGSWIIVAWVVIGVYSAADTISKIPKIVDGLKELKRRLEKGLLVEVSKIVRKWMKSARGKKKLPGPRAKLAGVKIDLDIGPLRELVRQKAAEEKAKLEFAQLDYDLVHREVINIKSFGANVFTGMLGIIGIVGLTIIGIVKEIGSTQLLGLNETVAIPITQSSSFQNLLPIAMLFPIVLISISLYLTIQQARWVNMRRGYMESVSEYLVRGIVPKHYCGWAKARAVLYRCKIHLGLESEATQNCGIRVLATVNQNSYKPACIEVAKRESAEINNNIRFIPNFLESFTSFAVYIYSMAYGLTVVLLLWSIMDMIQAQMPFAFKPMRYLFVIFAGCGLTGVFWLIRWSYLNYSNNNNTKNHLRTNETKARMRLTCYYYFVAFVFSIVLFGWITAFVFTAQLSWKAVGSYSLGGVICLMTVSLALACYDKVSALRRGRHSVERWRQIWKLCFEHCPLMDSPFN